MANSGIPAFSPRLQGCVPWQKFLLFSPSCQVRGTLEVSTVWEEKALGGWRDGVMAPALNWERERPWGREFGLCWLLAVIMGMSQPSRTLSPLSIQLGGGGQGYTSTPTPLALCPLKTITLSGPCNSPGDGSIHPTFQMFVVNPRRRSPKDLGVHSACARSLLCDLGHVTAPL